MYRLSLSQFGDLWKTNILMVNIGRTITFEKFIKILFFIAVHNAQISLMQSIYFIIQRMIATHSNEQTIVKLQLEENIHYNTFFRCCHILILQVQLTFLMLYGKCFQ